MLFDVLSAGRGADGFVPDTFRGYLLVGWDIRLFGMVPVGLDVQGRRDLFACENERTEKRQNRRLVAHLVFAADKDFAKRGVENINAVEISADTLP